MISSHISNLMSIFEKLDPFMQMPDTVEDLEGAINDALAEANAVLCNNLGVIEQYERRCEQVFTLHHP